MLLELRRAAAFALCSASFLLGGCSNSGSGSNRVTSSFSRPATQPPPQPTVGDVHFASAYRKVRGQVRVATPAAPGYPALLAISHESIPNFMEAMTMSMPLRNAKDAQRFKKGDKLRFDLVRHGGTYYVENASVLPASTPLKLGHF